MPLTRRDFLALAAASLVSGCGRMPTAGGTGYMAWGQAGRSGGAFIKPRAVEVIEGEVYVIDTTGRVQVFDLDGQFTRSWNLPAYENGTPTDLSPDGKGRLVIADTHYSRILECTTQGEALANWGAYGTGEDQFIYPTGVARTPDGTYYISEYGMDAERVHVFDRERKFLRQWGRQGSGEGEFSRAMAIGLDDEGTVYVVDTANHRVQCFDGEGKLLRIIGEPGGAPGQLRYPHDISFAPDGSIFVCEYGNHRVSRFRRDGTFIACYGRPGRKLGEFNGPRGVAVSDSGHVFVADTDNNRMQRIEVRGLR